MDGGETNAGTSVSTAFSETEVAEQTESIPNEEEEEEEQRVFCEEGQSDTDEGEDEDEEEEEKCAATEEGKTNKKRRTKRRRRSQGHRHNLKSKFDGVEDLNPEALSAQTEEQERIRRLELQQSLLDVAESSVSSSSRRESSQKESQGDQEILVVDLTAEEDDEDGEEVESIIIGDDPPPQKKPRKDTPETTVLRSKYDTVEPCINGNVLVNVNHPPSEPDVFLAPQLSRVVKPHQVGGIRFLYDNIVESLDRHNSSDGFGCILAHSMGLGKTLQVIAFIDLYLRHTSAERVMCVVPVNTLQNWITEFDMWLPISKGIGEEGVEVRPRNFVLFTLNESVRSMDTRFETIDNWFKMGGVLLVGYEMYRLLSLSVPSIGGNKMATKRKKPMPRAEPGSHLTIDLDETEKEMDALIGIQHALCSPGPDLVVCDEGHRIKNDATNLSQALKKLRTKRRIVLTGYPLQNNLLEYWCMIDFVRPNYLGTKHEFLDLFERPISNGQCMDSTANDVKLMRYRSHVLHRLLEGFVLRRGHEILRSVLLPKFEHVILLRSSHVQRVLYDYNMSQILDGAAAANSGPLRAFAVCSKIWNHPDMYHEAATGQSNADSPLNGLLGNDMLPSSSSSSAATSTATSCKIDWPHSVLSDYKTGVLENSPKMLVLMRLLDLSVANSDRVLIFSQSLSTLSYIEQVLAKSPIPIPNTANGVNGSFQYSESLWVKNKNYYRLDGSTSSVEREHLINRFNSKDNTECWLFMLSTRAGCLGINLVGANRVIVVDVSWNPCHDSQAVCRVYRYGQVKPCYVYRLVSDGTMEKKIYDRQISKQGMADRVVDEAQPERHFTASDIYTLLAPMGCFPVPEDQSQHINEFLFDPVLMDIVRKNSHMLTKLPFKHESLLIESEEERMSEVEKYIAVKNFQQQWVSMKRNQQTYGSPSHVRQQPVQQQQVQQQVHQQQVHQQQQVQVQQVQQQVHQQQQVQVQQVQQQVHHQQQVQVQVQQVQQQVHHQQQVQVQQVHQVQQAGSCSISSNSGGAGSSSSHASIGSWSGNTGPTGGGGDKVEVICLDSDSDDESSREASSTISSPSTVTSHPPTAIAPTILRPLSTAPHPVTANPRSPAVPILHPISTASRLPVITTASPHPVTCTADTAPLISTSAHSSLQESHTPSEAAIAQALANVIQFQRSLAKGLQGSSANGGSVMSSSSLPDTPSTRAAGVTVQPSPPPPSSSSGQTPSTASPLTALIQSIKQYSEPRPQTNRPTQSSPPASRTQTDHSQSPQNR